MSKSESTVQAEEINKRRILVAIALSLIAGVFAYQFFLQDGRHYVSPDGEWYLASARGEIAVEPFSLRIIGPLLISVLTTLTGLSPQAAFQLVTFASVIGSLLLLLKILRTHGAPFSYQLAILMAFGSGLAALFGHMPVLVDPLLLLFTCLFLFAVDRKGIAVGLMFVCLATLTKEYAVFLTLAWLVRAFRQIGWRAVPISLVPVALLIAARALIPSLPNDYFSIGALNYQESLISNPWTYFKTIYIWAWVALWPVGLLSVLGIVATIRQRSRLSIDQIQCCAMLLAVPVLMISDWDRTFVILVPFFCLAAASSARLVHKLRFSMLLCLGAFATALARPYYVTPPPVSLRLGIICVSIVATSVMAASIATFGMRQVIQVNQ
jgi:hypothetical protein